MRIRHLCLVAVLLAVPLSGFAKPAVPVGPRVVRIDLAGVPKLSVQPKATAFEPKFFQLADKSWGWIVRFGATSKGERSSVPSPAVMGDTVFMSGGLGSSQMFALDARTGVKRKSYALGDSGASTVAFFRHRVYLTTESCSIYAVDPDTAKVLWSRVIGTSVDAAPSVCGNLVVAAAQAASGPELTALTLHGGLIAWTVPLDSDIVGAPVCVGNRIFVTLGNGTLSCFSRWGRRLWNRPQVAKDAPWPQKNAVYVGAVDASGPVVVRINAHTGAVRWRSDAPISTTRAKPSGGLVTEAVAPVKPTKLGWAVDPPRPVVLDGLCLYASGSTFVALDTKTGREKYRMVLPAGRKFASPPAVVGHHLLYATAGGLLLEIDPEVGAVRRAFDLGVPVTSQPVVSRRKVYVTSDGVIYAVPWPCSFSATWSQWGGDASRSLAAR